VRLQVVSELVESLAVRVDDSPVLGFVKDAESNRELPA
jgi:hypothetical protein